MILALNVIKNRTCFGFCEADSIFFSFRLQDCFGVSLPVIQVA